MAFLKHWWTTDYAEDIFTYFLWKEKNTLCFRGRSPQLDERRRLVDMIRLLGERLRLANTSVHLAVRLLDLFMDNHRVERAHLSLVALGCLLLATKFEDRDCNVPQPTELHLLLPHSYPLRDYLAIEAILLEFFGWNVSLVTVAHFVEFLATRALGRDDTMPAGAGPPPTAGVDWPPRAGQLRAAVLEHLHYFMDLTLQDEHYALCYAPSVAACACLLAARSWLGVQPAWPAHLARLTGYSDVSLLTCVHSLLRDLYADEADARLEAAGRLDQA